MMEDKQGKICGSFWWFNGVQYLGALNDNFFKLLLIGFVISVSGTESASKVSAFAMALFVVPFLLFSAFAGGCADRFSKNRIIVWAKAIEALVMVLGMVGFVLSSVWILYGALFLMATQSAFFGPSKYGIIPELVDRDKLSAANGWIEALTYLAIISGALLAPLVLDVTGESYIVGSVVCIVIGVAGLLASLRIERTEVGTASKSSVFFWVDIYKTLRSISRKSNLIMAVFASAYFLLIVSFIQINLIPFGMRYLGFTESNAGYLFLPGALGIGVGSFIAGKLSGRNVEMGLVPIGALGVTVGAFLLGLFPHERYVGFVLIFLMGISTGIYVVPLFAYIQMSSPRKRRGRVIAASNFLGWFGVLLSAGLIYLFNTVLGFSPAVSFIVLSVLTAGLTVMTIFILPDFLVRFLAFVIARLSYRIKVADIDNLPIEGGALLVFNHCSWTDALVVNAAQQRRIRFIMEKKFYNKPLIKWIAKLSGAIPISSSDGPKEILRSLKAARKAIDDGYLVCVFAEGAMTRTGMVRGFRNGFEWILKDSDYKIIPGYIGGTWGSIFSYYFGRPLGSLPRRWRFPVRIHFGKAMAGDSTPSQVREKVIELSCDYYRSISGSERSLGEHFVRIARKFSRRKCISDQTGKELNYSRALSASVLLADMMRKDVKDQKEVGVLLPPSVGGVLANVGLTMLGRRTVNLNYVVSAENRAFAVEKCGLETIVTSRLFIKRAGIEASEKYVYIEDIVKGAKGIDKAKAYLKAKLWPGRVLCNRGKGGGDDVVTIIFSSGSSGEPKGVMLTHRNIYTNITSMLSVFSLYPEDNLCSILPFFHSFGYTCSLWLPIIAGVSSCYAANPLDCKVVGKLARENKSTVFFAAPSFLLSYVRRVEAEDFSSLRTVMTGAEKLKPRLSDNFEKKFGVRPLEGYGATELSPVVSLNIANVESDGVYQVGAKEGTAGHPLPGVAVKVLDIDSGVAVEPGSEGMLYVKGPNVMAGYYKEDAKTADVLEDGWYKTGDIARVDADGFVTITDRLSRFSKIGGEMVPHIKIEQLLLDALRTEEQLAAVCGINVDGRGEELVVLYLEQAGDGQKLYDIISGSELPNIFKPKRGNFFVIEEIPILGSGKLDLQSIKRLAEELKKNR